LVSRNLRRLWAFLLVLDDHDAVGAASTMAFQAFFSLVPLLAIAGWACHRLLQTGAAAFAPLFRLTPIAVNALADSEMMRLSEDTESVLPPLSVLGFLWLCSGGVSRAMLQFEYAFHTPHRTWLGRRALAAVFVLGAIATAALAVGAGLLLGKLGQRGADVAALALPFFGLWTLVGVFFRYATPRERGAKRHGFRGALVTLVCWAGLSLGFSVYVREIANYSHFYGGLAAFAVLLVWLWLMSLSLLVGAEINARIEGTRPPLGRCAAPPLIR
jgi:membrane protein